MHKEQAVVLQSGLVTLSLQYAYSILAAHKASRVHYKTVQHKTAYSFNQAWLVAAQFTL